MASSIYLMVCISSSARLIVLFEISGSSSETHLLLDGQQRCIIIPSIDQTVLCVTMLGSYVGRAKACTTIRQHRSYPEHAALFLIKHTLDSWLYNNQGFSILIGGPGAWAPSMQTVRYYVQCIREIGFRNSGRSGIIDAACNAFSFF